MPYKRTKLAGERLALARRRAGATSSSSTRRPRSGRRRRPTPTGKMVADVAAGEPRVPRRRRAQHRRRRGRRARARPRLRARPRRSPLPARRREPVDARSLRRDLRGGRPPAAALPVPWFARLRRRGARRRAPGASRACSCSTRCASRAGRCASTTAARGASSATSPGRRRTRWRAAARRGARAPTARYSAGQLPVRSNSSRACASRSRSGWLCGPRRATITRSRRPGRGQQHDAPIASSSGAVELQQHEPRDRREPGDDDPAASAAPPQPSGRDSARGRRRSPGDRSGSARCDRRLIDGDRAEPTAPSAAVAAAARCRRRGSPRPRTPRPSERLRRVLRERGQDHEVELGRHRRPVLAKRSAAASCRCAASRIASLPAGNGTLPGQRLVQDAAERVDVAGRADRLAAALLGRHVVDGADPLAGGGQARARSRSRA